MLPSFDLVLFRLLNGWAGRDVALDATFIFGAQHLIWIMAALIVAYVAAAWRTDHFEGRVENAWHVAVSVAIAFAAEQLIGFFWFRLRPFVALDGVTKLIEKSAEEKSFPSGHATAAFAIAFGLLVHNRRWGWAMVAAAAWVAVSRVFVGVHYPSDVLAGAVVGGLAALVTRPVRKAVEPYLELFPVFRKYRKHGV
jgi:undecaprenyl-diphosphatase